MSIFHAQRAVNDNHAKPLILPVARLQKPLPALGFDIWSSAGNVEPLIPPVARLQKPLPALGFDI